MESRVLNTRSRSRLAASLLLLCSAAAQAASPATSRAYCRAGVNTRAEQACEEEPGVPRLHYRRSCSAYAFNRDVFERLRPLGEDEVRAAFADAFAAWSAVDCGRRSFWVEQLPGVTGTAQPEFLWDERNESVVVASTADEWAERELDPSAVALTAVFLNPDTGEIYDVDLALHLGAGQFANCGETCAPGSIDLLNTIAHEAGHYLGLGHSTVHGATMTPYAGIGETDNASHADDDRDGYCALELPEFECAGDDCSCPPPPIYPLYARSEATASDAGGGCAVTPRSGPSAAALVLLAVLLLIARARRIGRG
jgi:hypothetical protein